MTDRATPRAEEPPPGDLAVDAFARLDRLDGEHPELRPDPDTIRAALMVACTALRASSSAAAAGDPPSVLFSEPGVRFRWWAGPTMALAAFLGAVVLRYGRRLA